MTACPGQERDEPGRLTSLLRLFLARLLEHQGLG